MAWGPRRIRFRLTNVPTQSPEFPTTLTTRRRARTESICRRYAIVDADSLREAA